MICVNDVLIICGCLLKDLIESRHTFEDVWDFCSVCLGTGDLLVWIGMLRCGGIFLVSVFILIWMSQNF